MPTTEYSIWDYAVSYGGPSLFMTAVFVVVLPLVYFKFARPRIQRWPPRIAVLLGVWVVAWCVAYGDVLWIAREAKRLCEEEAGLRVYGVAKATGFAGASDIRFWKARGFDFVEVIHPAGHSTVFEMHDQLPVKYRKPIPISRYEYKTKFESSNSAVQEKREMIFDRVTGQVLGEIVVFRPNLGALDRLASTYFGAAYAPKLCDGPKLIAPNQRRVRLDNLIEATLIPAQ